MRHHHLPERVHECPGNPGTRPATGGRSGGAGEAFALPPAIDGAGTDAKEGHRVVYRQPGIKGRQQMLTDVGGKLRACHPRIVPNCHNQCKLL